MKAGYICHVCGTDTTEVEVRERALDEGIENYLYHVARKCGEHHQQHSLQCTTKELDIKLPITGNGIGYQGEKLTGEELKSLMEAKPNHVCEKEQCSNCGEYFCAACKTHNCVPDDFTPGNY